MCSYGGDIAAGPRDAVETLGNRAAAHTSSELAPLEDRQAVQIMGSGRARIPVGFRYIYRFVLRHEMAGPTFSLRPGARPLYLSHGTCSLHLQTV
jgi:hypothetical protein